MIYVDSAALEREVRGELAVRARRKGTRRLEMAERAEQESEGGAGVMDPKAAMQLAAALVQQMHAQAQKQATDAQGRPSLKKQGGGPKVDTRPATLANKLDTEIAGDIAGDPAAMLAAQNLLSFGSMNAGNFSLGGFLSKAGKGKGKRGASSGPGGPKAKKARKTKKGAAGRTIKSDPDKVTPRPLIALANLTSSAISPSASHLKSHPNSGYRKKFNWDDKLHTKLLQSIFQVGLEMDRPLKTVEILEESGIDRSTFSENEVLLQVMGAREHKAALLKSFEEHLVHAQKFAHLFVDLKENKGGRPKFHTYPFSVGLPLATPEVPNVTGVGPDAPHMYNLRLMAAIFDIGLMYSKPKQLHQDIAEDAGPNFSVTNVKTHLQKFRNNSKTTCVKFRQWFKEKGYLSQATPASSAK